MKSGLGGNGRRRKLWTECACASEHSCDRRRTCLSQARTGVFVQVHVRTRACQSVRVSVRPKVENGQFYRMVDHSAEWTGDFPFCETTRMHRSLREKSVYSAKSYGLSSPEVENQASTNWPFYSTE
eukprot:2035550-Pleurochrysis_carterae.AAC.2